MKKIYEEILLSCQPHEAFNEMKEMDFIKKINPDSSLKTDILFQNNRVTKYLIHIQNVGSWESERVYIPESNTIITQRRNPLSPFLFFVVVHAFHSCNEGTLLKYTEEFETDESNKDMEDKFYSDISRNIKHNLDEIQKYFQKYKKNEMN